MTLGSSIGGTIAEHFQDVKDPRINLTSV